MKKWSIVVALSSLLGCGGGLSTVIVVGRGDMDRPAHPGFFGLFWRAGNGNARALAIWCNGIRHVASRFSKRGSAASGQPRFSQRQRERHLGITNRERLEDRGVAYRSNLRDTPRLIRPEISS